MFRLKLCFKLTDHKVIWNKLCIHSFSNETSIQIILHFWFRKYKKKTVAKKIIIWIDGPSLNDNYFCNITYFFFIAFKYKYKNYN